MKKIAIVNQRYGLDVNGGSEYYTRQLAEHLKKYYYVEVLTTTAQDYTTWRNVYPVGKEKINGVCVRRFPVKRERKLFRFRIINKIIQILLKLGVDCSEWWVREQGPYVPELIQYIKEYKKEYDVFIFVTYLYYTTVMGLSEVAEKSILIPTAHDEPYIYFPSYRRVFQYPQKIIYLTDEERDFVHRIFVNQEIFHNVIGIGIDIPNQFQIREEREKEINKFRKKYKIKGEYIVYAGRIDYGKNCDEMFSLFLKLKKKKPMLDIQLVLIGKCEIEVPNHSDIHVLGFLSEDDKYAGIAGAKYLWLPSKYESFSIALLEGMALGVPGIVNGNSSVLRAHCEKSSGSIYYKDEEDFLEIIWNLLTINCVEYTKLCKNAKKYVEDTYQWEKIEKKLVKMIE